MDQGFLREKLSSASYKSFDFYDKHIHNKSSLKVKTSKIYNNKEESGQKSNCKSKKTKLEEDNLKRQAKQFFRSISSVFKTNINSKYFCSNKRYQTLNLSITETKSELRNKSHEKKSQNLCDSKKSISLAFSKYNTMADCVKPSNMATIIHILWNKDFQILVKKIKNSNRNINRNESLLDFLPKSRAICLKNDAMLRVFEKNLRSLSLVSRANCDNLNTYSQLANFIGDGSNENSHHETQFQSLVNWMFSDEFKSIALHLPLGSCHSKIFTTHQLKCTKSNSYIHHHFFLLIQLVQDDLPSRLLYNSQEWHKRYFKKLQRHSQSKFSNNFEFVDINRTISKITTNHSMEKNCLEKDIVNELSRLINAEKMSHAVNLSQWPNIECITGFQKLYIWIIAFECSSVPPKVLMKERFDKIELPSIFIENFKDKTMMKQSLIKSQNFEFYQKLHNNLEKLLLSIGLNPENFKLNLEQIFEMSNDINVIISHGIINRHNHDKQSAINQHFSFLSMSYLHSSLLLQFNCENYFTDLMDSLRYSGKKIQLNPSKICKNKMSDFATFLAKISLECVENSFRV